MLFGLIELDIILDSVKNGQFLSLPFLLVYNVDGGCNRHPLLYLRYVYTKMKETAQNVNNAGAQSLNQK